MTQPIKITTKEQAQSFIDSNENFLFDCDGVLWLGNTPIRNAINTLKLLRSLNKRLIFVTNNAMKSRQDYVEKFASLGFEIKIDDMFSSAFAAAVYVSEIAKIPKDKKALVIGQSGLTNELNLAGIETIIGPDPKYRRDITDEDRENINIDPSIGAVVCGLDLYINYLKIAHGLTQLRNPKTIFVATNMDSTFPSHGKVFPGAGTVVSTLMFSSGREPVVCGKPSQIMMDCVQAKYHLDPKKTVMVGDRLNTDIKFGNNGGLATLMVLTGIENEETVLSLGPDADSTPDFYAESLGNLYELLKE